MKAPAPFLASLRAVQFATLATVGALACISSAQATQYDGNGNTGFGGAIGTGSLTLSDDGSTLSGTVTRGSGTFDDVLVIYIDSVAGGFADTSGFADNADGGRQAISGFDGSNRSLLTFASGFSPDYAIALGPTSINFGGLWQLADGGANSLTFSNSVNLSPTGDNSAASYTFSLSLADIGIGAGASFELFGTYISNTGYRSDEAVAGDLTGTQGWSPFLQSGFATYVTAVPEPSSVAILLLGGSLLFLRRKHRSKS